MSLKEEWVIKLQLYRDKYGETISIKELSGLTWNWQRNVLTYQKIYSDCKKYGLLPHTQLGEENSKCAIVISAADAYKYLKGLFYSEEDITPESKLLPFPA